MQPIKVLEIIHQDRITECTDKATCLEATAPCARILRRVGVWHSPGGIVVADDVVVALANNLAVLHDDSAKATAYEQQNARSNKDEREVSPTDVCRAQLDCRIWCKPWN